MDETKRSKQEALDKRYIRMASIWADNIAALELIFMRPEFSLTEQEKYIGN